MASEPTIKKEPPSTSSGDSLQGQTAGINSAENETDSSPQVRWKASAMKNSATEGSQEAPQYAKGLPLVLICFGLALAVICLGLDRTIMATAIPKITQEFNSVQDVAWYGSAFLLTNCCFQLMFGKLYGEYQANWVFIAALALFEIGSIFCAAAPNSTTLIIGRAIAGIGSAGIATGGFTILAQSVPLQKRPMYMGYIKAASTIAQVLAPTLGGVLTDRVTWRWCFWINLPLGGATAVIIAFLVKLPRSTPSEPHNFLGTIQKMDPFGTAVLAPCLICLLLAVQWGGAVFPWSNWRIVLCLTLFGVLSPSWVYIQYRQGDKGTLPLRIAKQRSIASGMLYMLAGSGALFAMIYYVPIWFQTVAGASAEQSGVNFLSSSGPVTLAAALSGISVSKSGYYVPQMMTSSVLTSIASGLIYRYNLSTSTAYWVGTQVMFGFGAGLGFQMPITAAQTVLEGPDMSIGIALILLVQTLGGAVFLAVAQNVFQNKLLEELAVAAPEVNPSTVLANGAAGISSLIARLYGVSSVQGVLEAYNSALQQVFLVCVVLSCTTLLAAVLTEWKNVELEADKIERAKKQMKHGQPEKV